MKQMPEEAVSDSRTIEEQYVDAGSVPDFNSMEDVQEYRQELEIHDPAHGFVAEDLSFKLPNEESVQ